MRRINSPRGLARLCRGYLGGASGEGNLDFSKSDYQENEWSLHHKNINKYFLDPGNIDLSDAIVFTDEKSQLAITYNNIALSWRGNVRRYINKNFNEGDLVMVK